MAQTRPATGRGARLTAGETGEFDLARVHLRALVRAAAALLAAADHDPDRADCTQAGCRLASVDAGPRLCALTHRLVLVDPGPDAERPAAAPAADLEAALADFRLALLESLDAVRACRSVGHAEGRCWFAPGTRTDVCGEVLRVAHLAG